MEQALAERYADAESTEFKRQMTLALLKRLKAFAARRLAGYSARHSGDGLNLV
jgi:hypothetical protein